MTKALCILFFIVISFSYGQKPFFQTYSLLRKNEHIKLNTVFQDKVGYIWFGTDRGLYKFDGFKYKIFTTKDGLPDSIVTAINEDSLGRIWTGHQGGALAIIQNETISKFNPPEGLSTKPISDILFDREGRLWFSTLDDGLYYFQNERLYRLDEIDGMPDLFINDLELDGKGSILAGTDRGLVICSVTPDSTSLRVLDNSTGLPDNIVKKIVSLKDRIWMVTEDTGLISFDQKTKKYKVEIKDWNFGSCTDLIINNDEVWISSVNKGLMIYDLVLGTKEIYSPDFHSGFAGINRLLKDREGNIWVACSDVAIRLPDYTIEHLNLDDKTSNGDIVSLIIDKNGDIWYSYNGKLWVAHRDINGKFKASPKLMDKIGDDSYISSLYLDDLDNIWIGFLGQGVARLNPISNQLHYYGELEDKSVLSITGSDNVVWISTLSGAVQIKSDKKKEEMLFFGRGKGLSSDYIYRIFIDSRERVWFATDGMGVDMLDDLGIHHFEDGLKSKVIYGFVEDGQHRIWANAQGDGLYEFKDSTFIPLAIKNDLLVDHDIISLSADRYGNLVTITDVGISIYDVPHNKYFNAGEELDPGAFKPSLNSVASDNIGGLYFGTNSGIVKYYPRMKISDTSPIPLIESLKVLDETIPLKGNLKFNYNENEITINYTGLWFQNSSNLHFQYRLKGFDRNWIGTQDHTATYSDLPSGEYSFHLKVSDTDLFEDHEAVVVFSISPPFWETPLFYSLNIILILVLGYSFIKYREKKLIRDNHELQAKIKERTLEIQKQNEEIQAQAEEIQGINENLEGLVHSRTRELELKNKALEEYAFITAHELRGPLASILGLIAILQKCKLEDEDKIILDHLNDSSERLNKIVRSITTAIEKGDKFPS